MTSIGERLESVLPLLRRGAETCPHAPAVTVAGSCLTHGELWRDADALAARLHALGFGAEDIVAIVLDRDVRWASSILGVMASGAAFLPIDASLPDERIRYMLRDSGARHVVTNSAVRARLDDLPGTSLTLLDDVEPEATNRGAWGSGIPRGCSAAYVIYTSGSTGAPKGVVIEHRSLAFSLEARLAYYADTVDGAPPRVLSAYGFGVDSVLAGFFWAIACGGHVILPGAGEERDATALGRLMVSTQPTHLDFVPGLYSLLLEMSPTAAFRSLRCAVVGGEALARGVLQQHAVALPGVPLVNEYGPTECTIWASAKRFAGALNDESVSIGLPLPETAFLVADADGAPVPDGEAGELWITGPHVARCYLGDPGRTAQRFRDVVDRDGRTVRAYHAGDRVRRLPSGEYVHLGRSDHQVKVSGFRVELGEVEFALAELEEVRQAVVVLHGPPHASRLVAYAVLHQGVRLTASEMRHALRRLLPHHMIPAILLVVEAMPLTPTGKIDRQALPSPIGVGTDGTETAVRIATVERADKVERAMADAWGEVLGHQTIRRTDNFFELGGNSLMAVRVVAELSRTHGFTIDASDLFHRSLHEIGADLRQRTNAD